MNVLIILKTIFLYIKNLVKGFGTECAPQRTNESLNTINFTEDDIYEAD